MDKKVFTITLLLLVFLYSCTPKLEKWYFNANTASPKAYEVKQKKGLKRLKMCRNQLNYIPDTSRMEQSPARLVRVNFHWMNASDSTSTFEKGKAFDEKSAIEYTKGLIMACNYDLNKNSKLWLPQNNDIPVIPPNYQLVLSPRPDDPEDTGVYFHYDDELYYHVHKGKNSNLYKRNVFDKYAVQLDTVLNIFILPHHPDSVASSTYNVNRTGVALRNCLKFSGIYEQKGIFWDYRGLVNHEIGHIFGLSHAWTNDGCDDTFRHNRKCWGFDSGPGCDTMTSNNMMGYNALQNGLSPAQIGRVHKKFSDIRAKQRKFLVPLWCEFKADKSVHIRDSTNWQCNKDLEGHLIIESGASLSIFCRLSLPSGAKIIVKPGATLILDNCRLHNDCGEKWEGIEVQKLGDIEGKVVLIGEVKVEDVGTISH